MKGFSSRNLKYMRTFEKNYPNSEFVQEALAQITWYHNIAILEISSLALMDSRSISFWRHHR
jgi:hypothetical protein